MRRRLMNQHPPMRHQKFCAPQHYYVAMQFKICCTAAKMMTAAWDGFAMTRIRGDGTHERVSRPASSKKGIKGKNHENRKAYCYRSVRGSAVSCNKRGPIRC